MRRVGQDAERTGRHVAVVVLRDGLEHAVVPIVGLEESAHRQFRLIGHEQYRFALFQALGYISGQCAGNGHTLLQRLQIVFRRVNPQLVRVRLSLSFDGEGQVQFCGIMVMAQVDVQCSGIDESVTFVGDDYFALLVA